MRAVAGAGDTLLAVCAGGGWTGGVRLLLERGRARFNGNKMSSAEAAAGLEAFINAGDTEGNTALHVAFAHGHHAVQGILLAAGADAARQNVWGLTYIEGTRPAAQERSRRR